MWLQTSDHPRFPSTGSSLPSFSICPFSPPHKLNLPAISSSRPCSDDGLPEPVFWGRKWERARGIELVILISGGDAYGFFSVQNPNTKHCFIRPNRAPHMPRLFCSSGLPSYSLLFPILFLSMLLLLLLRTTPFFHPPHPPSAAAAIFYLPTRLPLPSIILIPTP